MEVAIPAGTEVRMEGNAFSVKGKLGEVRRTLELGRVVPKIGDGRVVLSVEKPRKVDGAQLGTVAAHLRNMVEGANNGYTYKLKILFAHFPINVSVEKGLVVIKNFIGEKNPRYARIVGDIKVEVKAPEMTVRGIDIEAVGQTAANIEQATRIRKKDKRVFGDGIFITSKGEKK